MKTHIINALYEGDPQTICGRPVSATDKKVAPRKVQGLLDQPEGDRPFCKRCLRTWRINVAVIQALINLGHKA